MSPSLDTLWAVAGLNRGGDAELAALPVGVTVKGREILAGVAGDGSRYLLFPASGTVTEDTLSEGVQLRGREFSVGDTNMSFAALYCTKPWLDDVFSDIALECLNRLSDSGEPDVVVHGVLEEWRELLAKKSRDGLSDESVLGLIGELDLLSELAVRNPLRAIECWLGPAGGRHDFRNGTIAIEVKTSRRRRGVGFTVNGVDQLQVPQDARLFLRVVRAERVPGGRMTLAHLARQLSGMGVTESMLNRPLSRLGLSVSTLRDYDHVEVDVVDRLTYRVDDHFPRIAPSSFAGGKVPPGVVSLTYSVELVGQPPYPLSSDALAEIYEELLR